MVRGIRDKGLTTLEEYSSVEDAVEKAAIFLKNVRAPYCRS